MIGGSARSSRRDCRRATSGLHAATDSELRDRGLDVRVERLIRADVIMLIPGEEVTRAWHAGRHLFG